MPNPATHADARELIALQGAAARLDLSQARSARALRVGSHLSRFRGRGMDYQESRAYQAGDEIRSMDWRVTARTGRPHTKVYQEERERPVFLFVDLHPGMFFASRGVLKSVAAARAASLIAWAAAAQGDRVGGMLFNHGFHDLEPRSGREGVLHLIRALVEHGEPRAGLTAPPRAAGLDLALARLRRVSRPGSLVLLLGDFQGFDAACARQLVQLRRHSDAVAIRFVDPLEEAPPPAARYGVQTADGAGVLDTRSSAARLAYAEYFGARQRVLEAGMRSAAIALLRISTQDDVAGVLHRHFAAPGTRVTAARRAA